MPTPSQVAIWIRVHGMRGTAALRRAEVRCAERAATRAAGSQVMRAVWKDTVIAESADTIIVDGNHYFPRESLNDDHVVASDTTSVCGWKGTANY
jgi:uncharacterized protein (DUF427 family)